MARPVNNGAPARSAGAFPNAVAEGVADAARRRVAGPLALTRDQLEGAATPRRSKVTQDLSNVRPELQSPTSQASARARVSPSPTGSDPATPHPATPSTAVPTTPGADPAVTPDAATPTTVTPPTPLTAQEQITLDDDIIEKYGNPLDRPIHETRAAQRSTYRDVASAIVSALTFIPNLLVEGVKHLFTAITFVLSHLLSALINGPIWLVGKIAGIDTASTTSSIFRAINAGTAGVFGLIEGAIRTPVALMSNSLNFLENLFSFEWIRSGRGAVTLALQPLIGIITAGLGPLFYAVRGMDDVLHPPTPLTAAQREALALDYPPELLDRLRIHDGRSSWIFAILGRYASAQTHGHDIYLRNPELLGRRLMRHEVVHTLQTLDHSPTTGGDLSIFMTNYLSDLVSGLIVNGGKIGPTYDESPYEQEAEGLEIGVRRPPSATLPDLLRRYSATRNEPSSSPEGPSSPPES